MRRTDATRWPEERPIESITFIVRVSRDKGGGLFGIVEHVRTGRKERFERLEAMGGVIAALMPAAGPGTTTSDDDD